MTDSEFEALLGILDEISPPERVDFLSWKKGDTQETRANKLLLWWFYYFRNNFRSTLADFHYEWLYEYAGEKNLLFVGFRGSLKTEIRKMFLVYQICYKLVNFSVWQSYGSDASEGNMRNIAKMLRSSLIMQDYGELFRLSGPRDDIKKRSMGNWNTENGIRMSARSLGEKLRGEGEYDEMSGSSRPDDLTLDDIDVSDSVRNSEIIEKNYLKITGETFGALSKEKSRIIFLGNIINEDGVVPRFLQEKENDPNWKVFRQPLYKENGEIAWDYFTEERIQKIRSNEGEIAFGQNYLLVPYLGGETIIKREYIHWRADVPTRMTGVTIGIDPASSTKTFSDSFAMVVCGHIGMRKIILETRELKGQDKGTENMLANLREAYDKWNASCVNIEFVSLQREFCEYLFNLLRNNGFAVRKIVPTKDKVARLSEKEGEFSRGDVEFVENIGNKNLVSQLLKFPNVEHDDMVDAMVYAMEYRKPPKFGIVEVQYNS